MTDLPNDGTPPAPERVAELLELVKRLSNGGADHERLLSMLETMSVAKLGQSEGEQRDLAQVSEEEIRSIDQKADAERHTRVQRHLSAEARTDGRILAYTLFKDHDALFPRGRLKVAQTSPFGRLVELWLDTLPKAEKDRILSPEDRGIAANVEDAIEWWRAHGRDVASGSSMVPWAADGLELLAQDALEEVDGDQRLALIRLARRAQAMLSAEGWRASVVELLAAVRLIEQTQTVDREDLTDAVLPVLARIRGVSTGGVEAFGQFLGGLHALLWFGTGKSPSEGVLQSLTAIGDVAAKGKVPALLRLSIAIYEFTLSWLSSPRGQELPASDWRRARIAANNISGHLSALYGFDAGVDAELSDERREVVYLMNRMQTVSVLGAVRGVAKVGGGGRREDWEAFGFDLSVLPSDAGRLASAGTLLRAMNNVLSGWMFLDPGVYKKRLGIHWPDRGYLGETSSLVIAAFGALLRARQSEQTSEAFDEPVVAMFNAGLSLNRIARQHGEADTNLEAAEMVFYGAGLLFALSHGGSLRETLQELHGASCIVNLLGCATRMLPVARRNESFANAMQLLVDGASAVIDSGDMPAGQAARLAGSLNALASRAHISPRPFRLGSRPAEELMGRVEPMIDACVSELGLHQGLPGGQAVTVRSWRDDFVPQALPVMRDACRFVLNGVIRVEGQSEYVSTLARLSCLLATLVEMESMPGSEALQELVKPVGSDSSAIQRLLSESVVDRADWRRAFEMLPSNRQEPAAEFDSYCSWLDTKGILAWLPHVQLQ